MNYQTAALAAQAPALAEPNVQQNDGQLLMNLELTRKQKMYMIGHIFYLLAGTAISIILAAVADCDSDSGNSGLWQDSVFRWYITFGYLSFLMMILSTTYQLYISHYEREFHMSEYYRIVKLMKYVSIFFDFAIFWGYIRFLFGEMACHTLDSFSFWFLILELFPICAKRSFFPIVMQHPIYQLINNAFNNVIDTLPTRNYQTPSEEDSNITCVICYEEYQLNDLIKTLPCRHEFHQECIDTWLHIKPNCPLCQQHIAQQQQHATAAVTVPVTAIPTEV